MSDWSKADNSALVCYCLKVDKGTIIESIKKGNTTLSAIKEDTTACTGSDCKELNPSGKCCSKDIANLIQLYSNEKTAKETCDCCNQKTT